jgi:hypothetical protein
MLWSAFCTVWCFTVALRERYRYSFLRFLITAVLRCLACSRVSVFCTLFVSPLLLLLLSAHSSLPLVCRSAVVAGRRFRFCALPVPLHAGVSSAGAFIVSGVVRWTDAPYLRCRSVICWLDGAVQRLFLRSGLCRACVTAVAFSLLVLRAATDLRCWRVPLLDMFSAVHICCCAILCVSVLYVLPLTRVFVRLRLLPACLFLCRYHALILRCV